MSSRMLTRSASEESLPGPGAYDPAFGSIRERLNALTRKLSRDESNKSLKSSHPPTPGPGQYIKSNETLNLLSRR